MCTSVRPPPPLSNLSDESLCSNSPATCHTLNCLIAYLDFTEDLQENDRNLRSELRFKTILCQCIICVLRTKTHSCHIFERLLILTYIVHNISTALYYTTCAAPAQESSALTFPGRQLCPELLMLRLLVILAIGVSDDHMRCVIMSHDTHLCHPPRSSLAISSLGSDS